MRKTKHWLMTIAMLLCSLAVSAQTFEMDGLKYTILSSTGLTVEVYKGSTQPTDNLIIPATVTYEETIYSVTSIGDRAFYCCGSLTTITIPESITSIGHEAFYGCSSLTSVHISSIEAWCKISFASRYSNPIHFAQNLYVNEELVTTLIIPEDVVSIGSYAFCRCTSIKSVIISEGITSIGERAFADCSSIQNITLPESITSIGTYVFSYCTSLDVINIPQSLTNIGEGAFNACHSIKNINIPEGVTSIKNNTFCGCSNLTTINIPESVTSIGNRAFDNCRKITSIVIPERITSIGSEAFSNCRGLKSINIPKSVTSIGREAFFVCNSLTEVHISDIEAWCKILFDSGMDSNPLYYAHDLYLNGELVTELVIPEGVTSINNYVFCGGSSLTNINIPKNSKLTSIGYRAFSNCSSLININIPKSVTSIDDWAFSNCSDLTSITCEAINPPTIKSYTFSGVEESIPLYVPESAISTYQAANYWKNFTKIIGITLKEQSLTLNQYGNGTYCSEYALDFSEVEGLKAYAATGYNTATGTVTLTRVMTSKPGMGLFLKGEPGEYIVPVLENTDDNSLNMLVGTLEDTDVKVMSSDGLYYNYIYSIMDGDEVPKFYQVEEGYTLGAGQAYLQIPATWMTIETKSIAMRFYDGDDETDSEEDGATDIENETIDNNQQQTIIYNLMGHRVTHPLKGNVYIVNGKKVIWE